jgi:hypothetical protein
VLTLFPVGSPYFRGDAAAAPPLALLGLVVGPALLVWLRRRPPSWRTTVVAVLGQAAAVGALSYYDPILIRTVQGLALLLPTLLLAIVCWGLARARSAGPADERDTLAVALGLTGLASWLQYYPVECSHHVFWAMSPAIGFAVFALWKLGGYRTTPVALLVGVLLLPLAATQVQSARLKLRLPLATVTGVPVLAGMRAPAPMVTDLERVYAAVTAYGREAPLPPMMLEGDDPLLGTFVEDLRNPSPYFVLWARRGGSAETPETRPRFVQQQHPLIMVQPWSPRAAKRFAWLYRYLLLVEAPSLRSAILRPQPRRQPAPWQTGPSAGAGSAGNGERSGTRER